MGKCTIHADVEKNILFTTLEGFCTVQDLQNAPAMMKQETLKLKTPFVAITDIRKFQPAQPEAQALILKGMEIAMKNGMSLAIRIVNEDAVIGSIQFQRISQTKLGYKAIAVLSPEKALQEAAKHYGKRKTA